MLLLRAAQEALTVFTNSMSLDTKLQSLWYGKSRVVWLLVPLSWLYAVIVAIRRWLYRIGLLQVVKVSKPVVVIGNITVGGTGKTPLVIWLAQSLASRGYKVGVIARGYRGKASTWPQVVTRDSDPNMVGDEPVLVAQQTSAIVVVGPDRAADAHQAIALGADIIISDDGLQHYRLQRDVEIVVLDSSRMIGNGWLLPVGPLRESPSRLQQVDLVLVNQRDNSTVAELDSGRPGYRVVVTQLRALTTERTQPLDALRGQSVHVVTGIGNPQAFLNALINHGLTVIPHVLPDHARFAAADIQFNDTLPVLMTAKDAVKCRKLGVDDRYWVVDAQAVLDDTTTRRVIDCVINGCTRPN